MLVFLVLVCAQCAQCARGYENGNIWVLKNEAGVRARWPQLLSFPAALGAHKFAEKATSRSTERFNRETRKSFR